MTSLVPSEANLPQIATIAALTSQWDVLVAQIRPECRGRYLDNAHKALDAELWDAALAYFWQATVDELRRMVEAYGITYFASTIGDARVKDIETLSQYVPDHELIEHAHKLGVINREAHFQLQHCRGLRNLYSPSHPTDYILDPLEALNFIKNCVRLVLSVDRPLPGADLRVLTKRMRDDDLTGEVVILREGILSLPVQIADSLIQIMFTDYVAGHLQAVAKQNINLLGPSAWERSSPLAKETVGQRFAQLYISGTEDQKREGFAFLKQIGGVSEIPPAVLRPLFLQRSQTLIDTHFGADNFYNEPAAARALAELGNDVPSGAQHKYVKSILLSFVGNYYGRSWGAQTDVAVMFKGLNVRSLEALGSILDKDEDVIGALSDPKPAERLRELPGLLEGTPLPAAYAVWNQWIKGLTSDAIGKSFRGRQ